MPVSVKKIGNKFRVVGPDGKPETKNGSPVDGGGHATKEAAVKQVRAINMSKSSNILASKLIAQLAEELGLAQAEGAAPITIMTDGTPENTMVMVNGQPIQFDSINLYCCTSSEYSCCDMSLTIKEESEDGMTVRKTMQLKKDNYEDKIKD